MLEKNARMTLNVLKTIGAQTVDVKLIEQLALNAILITIASRISAITRRDFVMILIRYPS